jgi:hypothetical protein
MRVGIYHEILPEKLAEVLREGVTTDSHGEKTDSENDRADKYLDDHRPDDVIARGLSRSRVVYGFLPCDDKLIDIRNGKAVDVIEFATHREQLLVRMTVDSADCFVSDLDLYDAIKDMVESDDVSSEYAEQYWRRVTPLDEFQFGQIRRPEAMIIRDIEPQDINVINVAKEANPPK